MKRIFVRGVSRSGGTLMVTILDAHPDIAMGYELYGRLLEPLAEAAPAQRGLFPRRASLPHSNVPVFASRASRGGVDETTFDELVGEYLAENGRFDTFAGRMRFVEKIVQHKMTQEGKQHWGTKIASDYDELLETFANDDCYFLFMQRDGRDVAASQKLVGNFNTTPTRVAAMWRKQIERFQEFAQTPGVNARFVRYETLTREPVETLESIVQFLGVPWSDNLLNFFKMDLSLYRKPCGHLSANQVNKAINTGSIGRWKNDLTPSEIEEFDSEAGDLLKELGYAA